MVQLGCTHLLLRGLYTALAGLWKHTSYITQQKCRLQQLRLVRISDFISPFDRVHFIPCYRMVKESVNGIVAQKSQYYKDCLGFFF